MAPTDITIAHDTSSTGASADSAHKSAGYTTADGASAASAGTDTRMPGELPAPVRTPVQRRITIAALAVAAVIVAAGIFGGGAAIGVYVTWANTHQSVIADQPQDTGTGSTGTGSSDDSSRGPSGETAPTGPGGRR